MAVMQVKVTFFCYFGRELHFCLVKPQQIIKIHQNSSRNTPGSPKSSPRASQGPPAAAQAPQAAAQELPRKPPRQPKSSPGTPKRAPKTLQGPQKAPPRALTGVNRCSGSSFPSRSAGTLYFTVFQRFPRNLS